MYPLSPISSTGVNSETKEKYTEVEDCAPHKEIQQEVFILHCNAPSLHIMHQIETPRIFPTKGHLCYSVGEEGLLIQALANHKDSTAEPSAYSNEFDQ